MNRFRVKGCELEVVFAQERRKSPNEMRGRVVNQQNHRGRDRSSSFERHQKQRRRDEGRDNRENKDDKDNGNNRSSNDRNSDKGGDDKGGQGREKSPHKNDGEE